MIQRFAILLPYFFQQRKRLIGIAATTVLLSLVSIAGPWPIKLLIDYALGDSPGLWGMSRWTLVMLSATSVLLLYALGALFDLLLSWQWMASGQRMVYGLMVDVYDRALRVPIGKRSRNVGDLLERMFNDTWCVYTVATDALISPLQQTITFVGIVIVASQVDVQLTLLSLVAAPAIAASVWWFGPRLKNRAKRGRETRAELTSFVHQTLTSLPLVQANWAQSHHQKRYHALADEVVATAQKAVLTNKSFGLVNGALSETGRALILLVGGIGVLQGSTTVGTLVLFMAYVRTMQKSAGKLLNTYAKLRKIEASVERLQEVMDDAGPSRDAGTVDHIPRAETGASIQLERVTYHYLPDVPAVSEISFRVAPGERIGIVGQSGAGKSTLAYLIASLAEPNEGRITINGVDLRKVSLSESRKQVSILLQDAFLLPISVSQNIAIGRPGATQVDIEKAATLAGAHDFISALPDGYETVLGERGSTLSVGQQQRVAIARAFLRDAPIIILDEPTSALDVGAERALLSNLEQLTAGKTTIIISHRLTTLEGVDRIFVFEDGRIVEQGTPEALRSEAGHFATLNKAQCLTEQEACT
ncbi:ABC transporter ATP-binding protein/permease [Aeoliella sp. ICT_H6.2]|uniref:ABC transporter ATP-binding protein/permease n=1 Tax=Aeoliella straminimaris TaxID=2954799 RepID=A0A9X2F982_9BACT|nr:ABC transporter ATP-binding protein [Aeoliella straminimaris]MCO6044732.1 ABC transporter ATP-binding protein/permease [Aeoliella straminimaris]